MKTELLLLLSNVTSIACVIAAANLASKGTEGWGWFLLIALLSGVYPKSIGGTKMTKNKQLTEYLKEVLNLANDVELSVYDEDNNTDDLSNGIVNVWVEKND